MTAPENEESLADVRSSGGVLDTPSEPPRTSSLVRFVAVALFATLLGALLFLHLGDRYLWQDEACTAVLAERMMRLGKPYSLGPNGLITMDYEEREKGEAPPAGSARDSVDYFIARGDFLPDTTWVGQPWGQFVLAGGSLSIFGHSAWSARFPFALAGWITALALLVFLDRWYRDAALTLVGSILILGNIPWILHARNCRYYAPSSLFLLLAFASYCRWRDGRRWGSAAFVVSAWCFFQFDFGTFWPTMGVFAVDALVSFKGRRREMLFTGVILISSIAPFVWYYHLWGRLKPRTVGIGYSTLVFLLCANQYLLPIAALPVLAWSSWRERGRATAPTSGARRAALSGLVVVAVVAWVPWVTPAPFYRYLAATTPLAIIALAFTWTRLTDALLDQGVSRTTRLVAAAALALTLVITPLASLPAGLVISSAGAFGSEQNMLIRREWRDLWVDLLDLGPDPNRDVINVLGPMLRPGDEVLINYEDLPLLFHTDAIVRGGLARFRSDDRSAPPPRFLIIRPNIVSALPPIREFASRHTWRPIETGVPSLPFGNIPDPLSHRMRWPLNRLHAIALFERAEPKDGGKPIDWVAIGVDKPNEK